MPSVLVGTLSQYSSIEPFKIQTRVPMCWISIFSFSPWKGQVFVVWWQVTPRERVDTGKRKWDLLVAYIFLFFFKESETLSLVQVPWKSSGKWLTAGKIQLLQIRASKLDGLVRTHALPLTKCMRAEAYKVEDEADSPGGGRQRKEGKQKEEPSHSESDLMSQKTTQ